MWFACEKDQKDIFLQACFYCIREGSHPKLADISNLKPREKKKQNKYNLAGV